MKISFNIDMDFIELREPKPKTPEELQQAFDTVVEIIHNRKTVGISLDEGVHPLAPFVSVIAWALGKNDDMDGALKAFRDFNRMAKEAASEEVTVKKGVGVN